MPCMCHTPLHPHTPHFTYMELWDWRGSHLISWVWSLTRTFTPLHTLPTPPPACTHTPLYTWSGGGGGGGGATPDMHTHTHTQLPHTPPFYLPSPLSFSHGTPHTHTHVLQGLRVPCLTFAYKMPMDTHLSQVSYLCTVELSHPAPPLQSYTLHLPGWRMGGGEHSCHLCSLGGPTWNRTTPFTEPTHSWRTALPACPYSPMPPCLQAPTDTPSLLLHMTLLSFLAISLSPHGVPCLPGFFTLGRGRHASLPPSTFIPCRLVSPSSCPHTHHTCERPQDLLFGVELLPLGSWGWE